MKKKTKQIIMVLFIVIIFGLSSIAFVAINTFSPEQQQNQLLTEHVIDGEINESVEYQYISWGYTFIRFYYIENDPFIPYIENIPDSYMTNQNQKQAFVLRFPSNETYIKLKNLNGETELHNLTYEKIFDALCEQLIVTPTECGLRTLLINETNATG